MWWQVNYSKNWSIEICQCWLRDNINFSNKEKYMTQSLAWGFWFIILCLPIIWTGTWMKRFWQTVHFKIIHLDWNSKEKVLSWALNFLGYLCCCTHTSWSRPSNCALFFPSEHRGSSNGFQYKVTLTNGITWVLDCYCVCLLSWVFSKVSIVSRTTSF